MTDSHSTRHSDHVDALLPAAALGILDEQDGAGVERHLAACEHCRSELEAYRGTAERLRRHPLRAPSHGTWDRIERNVSGQRGRRPWGRLYPRVTWTRWATLASGIAAGILVGALAGALVWGQRDGSPLAAIEQVSTNDLVFTLAPVKPDDSVAGRIFMNESRTDGVVAVTGLAPLPESERYAVWIVRDDEVRISAGTFTVDAQGSAVAPLVLPDLQYDWTAPGRYVALAISRVSVAAMDVPVGGPILVGPLY